jgi:hypothetical protein
MHILVSTVRPAMAFARVLRCGAFLRERERDIGDGVVWIEKRGWDVSEMSRW